MVFFFFTILWELNLDMTETLSEVTLLAGTIFGEADDQEYAGKVGVGLTVATRVKYPRWWGRNWRQVILCMGLCEKKGGNLRGKRNDLFG